MQPIKLTGELKGWGMVINENIYLKEEEQDWREDKLLAKEDSEFTTEK